ncbi:GNAT family N-acetyltransferase [Streptococcus suis]|uniref:Histone acetyltransferase HPA2-like acetyltransferase n=1 Tax=Streptococcus suis TaxID=1307 RepID=A0A0Z8C809_STRSU|nr:GNAT family N-acetyltransferase [Streptococcus suis]NQH91444.1 GNAT family N-acetyltransferase [Streptococcus suis]NQI12375.1 GNAT family N-acetyltransferase [Streptococcus suis]NQN88766.1 GNAT family N-acetyltransferase [Streptococcus suis]NQO10652.1 GNAT family N-acetyltransferase [Streptococcus suis]NQO16561.1 GNAT family N-acetyltransferase [Streptococcus suis]
MQIDSIRLEEVSVLQELAKQTFAETFAHDNDPEELEAFFKEAYSVEVLTKELSDPNCQHYFLRVDHQIAGYLKLNQGSAQTEQELENAFEIQRIYLLQAYQGRGLGKVLFEFALEKAEQSTCDWVWLGVWEHNLKAQQFYAKYGFEKFGQHEFAVGDKIDVDWLLKRPLHQKG